MLAVETTGVDWAGLVAALAALAVAVGAWMRGESERRRCHRRWADQEAEEREYRQRQVRRRLRQRRREEGGEGGPADPPGSPGGAPTGG